MVAHAAEVSHQKLTITKSHAESTLKNMRLVHLPPFRSSLHLTHRQQTQDALPVWKTAQSGFIRAAFLPLQILTFAVNALSSPTCSPQDTAAFQNHLGFPKPITLPLPLSLRLLFTQPIPPYAPLPLTLNSLHLDLYTRSTCFLCDFPTQLYTA